MAQTEQLRKSQGFTLMELLIVVGILVILIAVSIPVFAGQIQKAKVSTDQANIRSAKAAAFAEYLTTEPSEDIFYRYDAASGKVVTDPNAAQTIKGYGKSNKEVTGATGIPNVNGVARYLVVKIAVKNYTVWTSTVTEVKNKYGQYKILEGQTQYKPSTSITDNNNQSYTKALEYYEELDKKI